MYLSKIYLENFLSYEKAVSFDVESKLVIVGANGSGKSNILRFFRTLLGVEPNYNLYWKDHKSWDKTKPCKCYCRFKLTTEDKEFFKYCLVLQLISMDNSDREEREEIGNYLLKELTNPSFMEYIDVFLSSNTTDPEELKTSIIFPVNTNLHACYLITRNNELLLLKDYQEGNIEAIEAAQITVIIDFSQMTRFREFPLPGGLDKTIQHILDVLFKREASKLRTSGIFFNRTHSVPGFREKSIQIKERLTLLGLNTENNFSDLPQAIILTLREKTGILYEDRGLLNSLGLKISTFGLKETIRALFDKKMSPDRDEQLSFQRIKDNFKELMDMEFDVVLDKVPVKNFDDPVMLFEPKREFYSPLEDYRVTLKFEKEDLIAHEPGLIFYSTKDERMSNTIDQAPGGAYEIIMVLTVVELSKTTTILLDEPGKTLHPVLLNSMKQLLLESVEKSKTLVYTTHSPELIGKNDLKQVIRCVKNGSNQTRVIQLKSLLESTPDEVKLGHFCNNPVIKSMFFSKQVCFLEGVTDERFINALVHVLMDTGHKFTADIVNLHGKDEMTKAVKVANHFSIDWVVIADFDAWKPIGGKSLSESRIGGILSQDTSFDSSKYSFLKKNDPYEQNVRNGLHKLERSHGIFTWKCTGDKGDLESAIQETLPHFRKKEWKEKSYHETIELAKELLNKDNACIKDLISFLTQKRYLTKLPAIK
ncbi:MAG: AAA family ATPase [Candidatus Odinarchaeota archaeon]